ncbi:ABC transporter substrate-binding protein [Rhodoferax aquaticus]|uniref:ABC transporter substrate-binding protein n=2 Tax=Rhodoferax aquaticus TaxID=2527691 RepID=A0A515EVN7_9BURK|nr:ABC transporter substrate-binding protein [Rhodoferax aquaticus]
MLTCLALVSPTLALADSKPIVLGQTYVQSGPLASLSTDPLLGIRAMLESVNRSGGIGGRPIELRQLDDAYDTARASANVKQLVGDGAVAILMPIGTSSSVGAVKTANELKVPIVGPYTGAAPVMKHTDYGFPVRISFEEECARIVNHLFTLGVTRIAFAHNDNPGARAAMESAKSFIEQRGTKMIGSVAIKNDASDAAAQAQELAKLKPEVVVFSASNDVTAKFIQAYRATGAGATFYSLSFLNGAQLFKTIDKDAVGVVISQVVPYPWNVAMPIVIEYQAAMKKIGVSDVSYASLEGYVSAKVVVEALKQAGPNPSAEKVKTALETFKALNLGGVTLRYTPTEHLGINFSELSMLRKDGSFIR